jgi:hypothetical protein
VRLIDRTGHRFSRLLVISRAPTSGTKVTWNCVCDCGKSTVARACDLTSGRMRSCGCGQHRGAAESNRRLKTKHGHSANQSRNGVASPEYSVWNRMKERCNNPNYSDFDNYGGRGITVCEEWNTDFLAFLRDVGPRPKGRTLDRINNNKGYYKENCRWATPKEQCNNRRKAYSVINRRTIPYTYAVNPEAYMCG